MKLLQFEKGGRAGVAAVDSGGVLRDLTAQVARLDGAALAPERLKALATIDLAGLPEVAPDRIAPCVSGVGKIVCIGLNYRLHAQETGQKIPEEPIIFLKATSSLAGPNDPILLPRGSRHTDWEIELGVVIGKRATNITEAEALSHVAGYCTANDVSERHFQSRRGGQWTKGKSADSFGPIGPWLVTADEVPDPQALELWCEVNGVRHQSSSTADMIFGVAFVVAYVSEFMTLEPGDVIMTGTPSGVGTGMDPKLFLKAGDRVRCAVEGFGVQEHAVQERVVQERDLAG